MKDLSTKEKWNHHYALKEYIDNVINRYILLDKEKIKLAEVGYGVPVDDSYIYFDFPYNETVDEFNVQLRINKHLRGVDVDIHDRFYSLQEKGRRGFIYYKYNYIKTKKLFVYSVTNNIGFTETDKNLRKFLPIMHCAVTNDTNYTGLARYSTTKKTGFSQIIVLSKRLGQNVNSLIGKNTLVCTFTVESKDFIITQALVDSLYEKVIPLLETYFNSPVLEKMLGERRKSEVLAYHHSIDNLELDSFVIDLADNFSNKGSKEFQEVFDGFVKRFKILRFLHYSLFQTEYIYSGRNENQGAKTIFPFADKSVCEIISLFISDFNKDELINHFSLGKNVDKVDFKPEAGMASLPNPELYDVLMVLWNIWQNSCAVALGQSAKEISISVRNEQNRLLISFKNKGKMDIDFLNYINGIRSDYPSSNRHNSNPNKKYRGLEIIKDKCNSHGRKWKLSASVEEESEKWHTTVSIHF